MRFAKLKKTVLSSLMLTLLVSSLAVVSEAADGDFESLKGKDRIETSIKVSRYVKSDKLVVANAYEYADSLSAYNIASKNKAKLILIDSNTDISDEIKSQKIKKVFIIGGEKTLNGKSVKSILNCVGDQNVKRLSGKNRYETNAKTLEEAGYKSVGVADGRNYADALASSGLLHEKNMGLMLVDGTKKIETDKNVVYTFGGESSVKYSKGKRIAGKSRYETNRLINRETKSTDVAIVDGNNFADAMSSINILCGNKRSTSIALVGKLDAETEKEIARFSNKFMVGGSLGSKIENKLKEKFANPEAKKEEEKKDNVSTSGGGSSSGGGGGGGSSSSSGSSAGTTTPGKTDKIEKVTAKKKAMILYTGDSVENIDYKKHIKNYNGEKFEVVTKPETKNEGNTKAVLEIKEKDGKSYKVTVPVEVKKQTTVKKNRTITLKKGDLEENIIYSDYLENLYDNDKVNVITVVDSSKEGKFEAEVEITHPNGSKITLYIPVEVLKEEVKDDQETPKDDDKENPKDDDKENPKDDDKENPKDDDKENPKDDDKEDSKEDDKENPKDDNKEDSKDDDKEDSKEGDKEDSKDDDKEPEENRGKVRLKDENKYYLINVGSKVDYRDYLDNWKDRNDIKMTLNKEFDRNNYSIQESTITVEERKGDKYDLTLMIQFTPKDIYLVPGEEPNYEKAIPGFKKGDILKDVEGSKFNKNLSEQKVKKIYIHDGKTEEVEFKIIVRNVEKSNIISNQDDFNRYFLNKVDSGLKKDDLYIKREFVLDDNEKKRGMEEGTVNYSISNYLAGIGLKYRYTIRYQPKQYSVEEYAKIELEPELKNYCYSNVLYNKDDFVEHMEKTEKLVEDSGVKKLETDKEKAEAFGVYLKKNFPYNIETYEKYQKHVKKYGTGEESQKNALTPEEYKHSIGPYTITDYGTGWCCAFVFTYNQAMRILDIPALSVLGNIQYDDNKEGGRHINTYVYYDNAWHELNVTGLYGDSRDEYVKLYENFKKEDKKEEKEKQKEKLIKELKRGMISKGSREVSYEKLAEIGKEIFGDRLNK